MASALQCRKRAKSERGDDNGGAKKTKLDWTPEEDAILSENVERHWKGSWKTLQEETGLPFSSKACRLRWVNCHRPGLQTSEFTLDEETRIRCLLDQLGHRWTDIAKHFPGRTDSEVKNFWYRNLRPRLQRGLTCLPPVVHHLPPTVLPSPPPLIGDFDFMLPPDQDPPLTLSADPISFLANWQRTASDKFLEVPMVVPPEAPISLRSLVQPPALPEFAEYPELPSFQIKPPTVFEGNSLFFYTSSALLSPPLPIAPSLLQSPLEFAPFESNVELPSSDRIKIANNSSPPPMDQVMADISNNRLPEAFLSPSTSTPLAEPSLVSSAQIPESKLEENADLPSTTETFTLAGGGDRGGNEIAAAGSGWLSYSSLPPIETFMMADGDGNVIADAGNWLMDLDF